MLIDTQAVRDLLDDTSKAGFALGKAIGIHPDIINGYRRGERQFDNLSLKTIKAIQRYIDQQEDDT